MTVDASGNINSVPESAPGAATNGSIIFINTNTNIVNPSNQSFVIQGTKQTIVGGFAQSFANAAGAPSLSSQQFGALLILHELKHIFKAPQEPLGGASQFNTPIWEKCLKGLP